MPRIGPHKIAICEGARALVESGTIARDALRFIELAEGGSDGAYQIVLRYICNSGPTREELSHFIELPAKAGTHDARRFSSTPGNQFGAASAHGIDDGAPFDSADTRFQPHIAEQIALGRARNLSLTPLPSSTYFEKRVFDEIEYSREMIADPARCSTVESNVRSVAVARLARIAIDSLMEDNSTLFMPPPPSSKEFAAVMREKLSADENVLESWMQWPSWNNVLASLFVAMLSRDLPHGRYPAAIDERRSKIALMESWFKDLSARGITPHAIVNCTDIALKAHNVFDRIRATAELRRFTHEVDDGILKKPEAAALLASDINVLHGMDPEISGRDFLRLLTPYAPQMTLQSITSVLKSKGIKAHRLTVYRAYLKLFWHAAQPADLAEALEWLISHNRVFKDLDKLLQDRLAVNSDALFDKIERMHTAGANVSPLLQAIARKFPNSVRRDTSFNRMEAANDGSTPPPDMETSSAYPAADEEAYASETVQLDLPGMGLIGSGMKIAK